MKGDIDSIVEAMGTHNVHSDVQEPACLALVNLAFNVENQVLIAEKDGIQGIIAAMNRHGTQIQILRFSCRALSMLGVNDDNKVKIAQEGGTETIVMTKRNNKEDKEIE